MSDFKIIAIRPLVGCDSKYVKVLKPDQVYTFYNDYKISDDGNTLTYTKTVPDYLYDIGVGKPKINISAIVGKNGTGKSTITELLIATINNIAYKLVDHQIKSLDSIPKLCVELFYKLPQSAGDNKVYKVGLSYDKSKEAKEKIIVRFSVYDFEKKKFEDAEFSEHNELVSFFYSIGVNYSHYSLNSRDLGDWITKLFHKNDGYQTPIVLNPMRTEGNIDINKENHLVYSRLIANLLRKKPKSGSLDYRKLSANQIAYKICFKLNSSKLQYAYREQESPNVVRTLSMNHIYEADESWVESVIDVVLYIFNGEKVVYGNIPYASEVCDYIIRKLISISLKYVDYDGYFKKSTNTFEDCNSTNNYGKNTGKFIEYLEILKADGSHITFKLKQAINYLIYNPLKGFIASPISSDFVDCAKRMEDFDYLKGVFVLYASKVYRIVQDKFEKGEFVKETRVIKALDGTEQISIRVKEDAGHVEITVDDTTVDELLLANPQYKIDIELLAPVLYQKGTDLIELIPPAIFDYDITLMPLLYETEMPVIGSKSSLFSALSSGEKQLIHSISSVTYHLLNVNSVFDSTRVGSKVMYSNVNILFDEIELYHHPDMQRKLIKYILDSIQLQELDHIEGINICFVTHSPFILSDIPDSNILFLDVDLEERVALPKKRNECPKTFGANIHDLLKNGFFMSNAVMGEFAAESIREIYQILLDKIENKKIKLSRKNIKESIDLVGEPVLGIKLNELYQEAFGDEDQFDFRISQLQAQIDRLKVEKAKKEL